MFFGIATTLFPAVSTVLRRVYEFQQCNLSLLPPCVHAFNNAYS